tara:strand:- start:14726 stop:15166 length:441 start_codon:yes stop_codon:yes gene_type:complete
MSEKSYVGMAYRVCPITGEEWETGEILMDRTMKDTFEKKTIIGYGFAPSVQEQIDKGYVALVEIDAEKSEKPGFSLKRGGAKLGISDAYKTGRVAYMKEHVAENMLGIPKGTEMGYIDIETFGLLEKLQKDAEGDDRTEEKGKEGD